MTPPLVMLVDDEAPFVETMTKRLERRDLNVIPTFSGQEALEALDEHQNVDVVILDVKIPGMDGHQVLEEIKKHSPVLPVIMLTGHGALPSAKEALQKGAFDYLSKPCDINVLAAKIEDACRHAEDPKAFEEKRILGVMVPFQEYTTVSAEETVKDAFLN